MEKLKVKTVISELADNEEFRDIENYEGLYQISNQGRVYSLISGKFLKPQSDKDGYLLVRLYKNKKSKDYLVHRLVGQAFLLNPLNLPQINHKSEIKTENHVSNLEWCSAKYNCTYGSKLETVSKPVLQFTREEEFVKEYPSVHEAARQTKIDRGSISKCCLGKSYKSCGGYIWKFKEEEVA